jgi:diaminohydroxyphosphoribosylaminopyrimidine deaminase/5-amino-6-(5-phosphoribosylamino)uracil reductase
MRRQHVRQATDLDHRMMDVALAVARRGLGRTAPNPSVGAVIFDEATGEMISRGWTQPGGRPHAETEAIARAGVRARGKTMYVTLEPCSHFGRTPPCASAIIEAGIARVVVATLDPDPRVSGRGIRMLREAGIEVRRGVRTEAAQQLTLGHILRVTERRPLVQLKMALGPDGTVPRGAEGKPVWATGPQARAHGHLLRAKADAILVGSGTVRDDDPELTCRLPGLIARSPSRILVAGRNLPSRETKLVATAGQSPLMVFANSQVDPDRRAALVAAGCRMIDVASVDGRPWLPAVMEALVAEGVTRLLVEGGPSIWRAFAALNLVDEVYLYQVRGNAGGAADPDGAAALARYVPNGQFSLVEQLDIGPDVLLVYDRN